MNERGYILTLLGAATSMVMAGCDCAGDGGVDAPIDASTPDAAGIDAAPPEEDAGPDSGSDCNLATGLGCPCDTAGQTRSCLVGAVHPCEAGEQECVEAPDGSVWGPCVPFLAESCNGLDDDCDGEIDEELGEVACGVGACAASVPACVDGAEQTCVPGLPGVESCNGADDDCDLEVDEGLGNVACGEGECYRVVAACTDGAPTACAPGPPADEVCDGLDNDCNGIVDDGFGTVVCGVGECEVTVLDCEGIGGIICEPGTPTDEVCDLADNDCDGSIDEDIADVTCGLGVCARSEAGCVGGVPAVCNPGVPSPEVCDGLDNDCDGAGDEDIPDLVCGVGVCRATAPACPGGEPGQCTPGPAGNEICANREDDDCDGLTDELCECDPDVDTDFDGADQCDDCDDANGAVFPGQDESCNGLDDDCDGTIDEGFDDDADGWGRCAADPAENDCDDSRASVNPGAIEDCGAEGTGNGIDEDCDGYVDETCDPCDPIDRDGDRVSECEGDCDDADALVAPGFAEVCEGKDTDCNRFTTENCDVSDPCNFDTDDDVCMEDLLCGCVVGPGGVCTGEWVCTSFCEGSFTGPLGAGCTETQTCLYRVTLSDNQHGCAESTAELGALGAGEVCGSDDDCRSGDCDRYCVGPGCNTRYCVDWCGHHDPGADGSCAAGTVCEIVSVSPQFGAAMYATCRLDDNGDGVTGDDCEGAGSTPCTWGTSSCVNGVCAEPCGLDAHCPDGTHCSLLGNQTSVGVWGAGAPAFVEGEPAIESVPVCLADGGAGQHDRQAGAACTRNGDCESELCEASLGVCVSLCTSDESCPIGLGCELQYVRTPPGDGNGILTARVCMSAPVDALLESM